MIRLHPLPQCHHACPIDGSLLEEIGWLIPGMRSLADLKCPRCGRRFYGDLPVAHGMFYPMLIDRGTGDVHDRYGVPWFADSLKESFAKRTETEIELIVESLRSVRCPLLVNCLDLIYGHSLLKLLNVQHCLDDYPELDVIVLVPDCLRWIVPDGVAEIWTVGISFRPDAQWNDWLASKIRDRISAYPSCSISVAAPHPGPTSYTIERFTRIRPFSLDSWDQSLHAPTVTFIWRDDRLWTTSDRGSVGGVLESALKRRANGARHLQRNNVIALAATLRAAFPTLSFLVAGLGHSGDMPPWIGDHRAMKPGPSEERKWCRIYSHSHVVVGVHGSNMLLPSAHAGSVVDLMPSDRWGNTLQDLLLRGEDERQSLLRNRIVPLECSPSVVSALVTSLLVDFSELSGAMQDRTPEVMAAKPT